VIHTREIHHHLIRAVVGDRRGRPLPRKLLISLGMSEGEQQGKRRIAWLELRTIDDTLNEQVWYFGSTYII